MPAWLVTKFWTDKEIGEYRAYAAKEGPAKAGKARCTCEDLSIRIVTEFASSNGLPLFFANGTHAFPEGITPEGYSTVDDFLNEVLTTTAARDLADNFTARPVKGTTTSDPNSLRVAQPGDLILLYEPIGHVQVVTSVGPYTVKISQGNFRPSGERAGTARRAVNRVGDWIGVTNDINQNDPTSKWYIGAIVAEKSYDLDKTTGRWDYDGQQDMFRKNYGRLMIWSFDGWNSRMIRYEVKGGDNVDSVAKAVYGTELYKLPQYKFIRVLSLLSSYYSDAKGNLRAGSVIYFWR